MTVPTLVDWASFTPTAATDPITVEIDTTDIPDAEERDGLVAIVAAATPNNTSAYSCTAPAGWTQSMGTHVPYVGTPYSCAIDIYDAPFVPADFPVEFTVGYGAGIDVSLVVVVIAFRRRHRLLQGGAAVGYTSETVDSSATVVPSAWSPTISATRDGYAVAAWVNPSGGTNDGAYDAGDFTELYDSGGLLGVAYQLVSGPGALDIFRWAKTPGSPAATGVTVAAMFGREIGGGWWMGKAPMGLRPPGMF